MVGHGGSSAGSYLTNPTYPIPSHCASIVATSKELRVNLRVNLPQGKPVHGDVDMGMCQHWTMVNIGKEKKTRKIKFTLAQKRLYEYL